MRFLGGRRYEISLCILGHMIKRDIGGVDDSLWRHEDRRATKAAQGPALNQKGLTLVSSHPDWLIGQHRNISKPHDGRVLLVAFERHESSYQKRLVSRPQTVFVRPFVRDECVGSY